MDDEALNGSVEVYAPWTIKSMHVGAKTAATDAARAAGQTVGVWLEAAIRDRLDGAPPPAQSGHPGKQPDDRSLGRYAAIAEGVRLAMALSDMPGDPDNPLIRTARQSVRSMLLELRPTTVANQLRLKK